MMIDEKKIAANSSRTTAGKGAHVVLTQASTVKVRPVDWLWPQFLPRGMLTLLAGLPGCGKSTLALALAATVTSAGRWPCGASQRTKGSVLIWSSEDAVDVTLTPRLMAMGADLTKCHFITGKSTNGEAVAFDPASDMSLLADQIRSIGDVTLIILDPVLSAVAGDSHKAAETRRGLQAVVDLASRYNIALLGITHFKKGSGGSSPAERVIGSQAFTALARMVLVAAKVEAEKDVPGTAPQRMIARAKSNISADDGGFSFDLQLIDIGQGIQAQAVTWGERIQGSALALLNAAESTDDGGDQAEASLALDDAVEFLKATLENGQVLTKTVEADAEAAGISKATLKRARNKARVKSTNSPTMGGWVMQLRTSLENGELAHIAQPFEYEPDEPLPPIEVENTESEVEF